MNKALSHYISLGIGLGMIGVALPAQAASFQGLGDLSGGGFSSRARDISADGSTVVGYSFSSNGQEAFRWTKTGGMVGLGDLSGGNFTSRANAVSADGSTIVGYSISSNGQEAFRWTKTGGMVGLGDLPGGSFNSTATAISSDGSVIVGNGIGLDISSPGSSPTYTSQAFRYKNGQMLALYQIYPTTISVIFGSPTIANDISADGSIIVGATVPLGSFGRPYLVKWTETNRVLEVLEVERSQTIDGSENVISADGSIIFGRSKPNLDPSVVSMFTYSWTEESLRGRRITGDINLQDTNADGSILVGGSNIAFIWDEINGTRILQDVLANDFGLDLTGWSLDIATGISDDGLSIVGWGTNPSGNTEAWFARLDGQTDPPLTGTSVPEPSSILGLGLFSLVGFLRKKRNKPRE